MVDLVSLCSVGFCSTFVFIMDGIPGGGRCGLDVLVLLLSGRSRGSVFACLVVVIGSALLLEIEVLSLCLSADDLTLLV